MAKVILDLVDFLGAVILCVALAGCAPGLGTTLRTDQIDALPIAHSVASHLSSVKVRVGPFVDARGEVQIGSIDGRQVRPADEVGTNVAIALERQLREAGTLVSHFDGPILSGDVVDWHFEVRPGFPATEVEAKASLQVRLSNSASQVVYTALYSGSVHTKHPMLSEDGVEKTLGQAMAYAIREALSDARLLGELERLGIKSE